MYFESKKNLASRIASHLGHPDLTPEAVETEFSTPPNLPMGHLALPCFKMAKLLGKTANEVAQELVSAISGQGFSGAVAGPYANFRFDVRQLYVETLTQVFSQGARYGTDRSGAGKRILLEYSSPNIAKRLSFQHLRSTLIGNTLANVYSALGYDTERICFVGDWGVQFARLLAAVELWGRKDSLDMEHLSELNARFQREAEENASLVEKAVSTLRDLEEGKPGVTELWKRLREISVSSMEKTLARLRVRFDHVEGESKYVPAIPRTLEEVKEKAHPRISDGAWIVDIDGAPTPALVQKRDGTTLYLTRDLAAAIDRWNRFEFDRSFYVVSDQQNLHFQLLFGLLAKMGYEWASRLEHLSFGAKHDGRAGLLDDVLDEAKKHAGALGIGAVTFGVLSVPRASDLDFGWNEIFAPDRETGPFVQHALERCTSVLEKAGDQAPPGQVQVPAGYEFAAEEEALILEIAKFRAILHQCVRENEPHLLARYLIDVAKAFSRFHYRLPVLQATEPAHRALRLHLMRATRQTLTNGLQLLGIT